MTPTEPPWRYLDPGIKDLVRLLWSAGFDTTDSGDGYSKPPVGRTLDVPHVGMVVPPEEMVFAVHRAGEVLQRAGYGLGPNAWHVEANYGRDGVCVVLVTGPAPALPDGQDPAGP